MYTKLNKLKQDCWFIFHIIQYRLCYRLQ